MVATECQVEIRVRYGECDPMNLLHHSRYFEYFEQGRVELLRQGGFSYRDLEQRGFFFVVAKLACKFRKPARFDDCLTLHVRIARQTPARIDHTYKMYRDSELLCEAETTLACVDRQGRIIPIPPELAPEE